MDKSTLGSNLNILLTPLLKLTIPEFLSRLWIFIVPFLFWNTCVLKRPKATLVYPVCIPSLFSSPCSLLPTLLSGRSLGSMGHGLHQRMLEAELLPTLQHHRPSPGAALVEQALYPTTHASFGY